jgi:hypothetical protein
MGFTSAEKRSEDTLLQEAVNGNNKYSKYKKIKNLKISKKIKINEICK